MTRQEAGRVTVRDVMKWLITRSLVETRAAQRDALPVLITTSLKRTEAP